MQKHSTGSRKLNLAAIIGSAGVFAVLWGKTKHQKSNIHSGAERQPSDDETKYSRIASALEAIVNDLHRNSEQNKDQEQKKSVKEWAGIFGLYLYTALTFFLLISALRSNSNTVSIFVNTQRPWVSVTAGIEDNIRFDKDGAHIVLTWTVKNLGHMPAQIAVVRAKIFVVGKSAVAKPNCAALPTSLSLEDVATGDASEEIGGPILFPDEERGAPRRYVVDGKSILGADVSNLQRPKNYIIFGIYACLGYLFDGSDIVHVTPVSYIIGHKVAGRSEAIAGFIKGDKVLGPSDFMLIQSNDWAGSAT